MRSIDKAIAVTSAKGGVLKTSIVANMAGLAAEAGWRVLTIDSDPQANLGHDLGTLDSSDDGRHLAEIIVDGITPRPVNAKRPRLDTIHGGSHLTDVARSLQPEIDESARRRLIQAINEVADDYDVIFVDTSPGDAGLRRLFTSSCRFAVVPSAPDAASINGLRIVLEDEQTFARLDPRHELLAVALGPIASNAAELRRTARNRMVEVFNRHVPVTMATIRSAQKVAIECRERGQLVIEYEAEAASRRVRRPRRSYSSAVSGLADDYQELTDEVLARFVDRLTDPDTPSIYL